MSVVAVVAAAYADGPCRGSYPVDVTFVTAVVVVAVVVAAAAAAAADGECWAGVLSSLLRMPLAWSFVVDVAVGACEGYWMMVDWTALLM